MRSSQGYPQNSKLRGMRRRTAAVLGPGGAGSDRAYARRGAANSAPTGWSCVACPKQKHILHIVMCAVIASCSAVVSLHAMHTIKYSHWVLNEELGIIEPAFTAAAREALLKPRSEDRSTSGANTGAGTLGTRAHLLGALTFARLAHTVPSGISPVLQGIAIGISARPVHMMVNSRRTEWGLEQWAQ